MKHRLEQLKINLEGLLKEDLPEGTPELIKSTIQDLNRVLKEFPGTDNDWPLPELAKAGAKITGKSYRTVYRRLDARIRAGELSAYIGIYTEILTRTKKVQLIPKIAGDLILQEFKVKKLQQNQKINYDYNKRSY